MKQAAAASADRKLDEALALYAKAIRLQPTLIEAHWYVASSTTTRIGTSRRAMRSGA